MNLPQIPLEMYNESDDIVLTDADSFQSMIDKMLLATQEDRNQMGGYAEMVLDALDQAEMLLARTTTH